jgi:Amt family ammonium transporter
VTTIMLKPRMNRFNPRYSEWFEPSNSTFICLSCLLVYNYFLYSIFKLWTCWIFFNAGSALSVTGGMNVFMARAAMNTFLSGASGALTVFYLNYFIHINGP